MTSSQPMPAGEAGRPGSPRPILIASNRGPVAFTRDPSGRIHAGRGGGGLVTALSGALQLSGGRWIAAAISDEDRRQARAGHLDVPAGGFDYHLRYLILDEGEFDHYYNQMSNRVLWFLHHYLWEIPRAPRFDDQTRAAWESYQRVNEAFALALDEEGGADGEPAFLVQDYHLTLVPGLLRARRPEAPIAWFSHIPFTGPVYFRTLPQRMREAILAGILGADVVGFHAQIWAQNFLLCCRGLPGAEVDIPSGRIRWQGRQVKVGIYPISIDAEELRTMSESTETAIERGRLQTLVGDRRLLLRVDRVELSKNILRGFLAYELLLERAQRWRGRIQFFALLNPSREGVPEYATYLGECVETAERVNRRFGTADWRPVEIAVEDNHARVVAAYTAYDALLVNPVFDGMNLVAKEGPSLNRRGGVLILSDNAGAAAELGEHALRINPFDLVETAEAMATALEMPEDERRRRAEGLRAAVHRTTLQQWVEDQLRDLEAARANRDGR